MVGQVKEKIMNKAKKIFTDEDKAKKIKEEVKKLSSIMKELSAAQQVVCYPLIENIAFCVVHLEELRLMLLRDGFYERYKNGKNQYGNHETQASKQYAAVGKLYTNYLKKLKEYLPLGLSVKDELESFKKKHKK